MDQEKLKRSLFDLMELATNFITGVHNIIKETVDRRNEYLFGNHVLGEKDDTPIYPIALLAPLGEISDAYLAIIDRVNHLYSKNDFAALMNGEARLEIARCVNILSESPHGIKRIKDWRDANQEVMQYLSPPPPQEEKTSAAVTSEELSSQIQSRDNKKNGKS